MLLDNVAAIALLFSQTATRWASSLMVRQQWPTVACWLAPGQVQLPPVAMVEGFAMACCCFPAAGIAGRSLAGGRASSLCGAVWRMGTAYL